ncbi:MAG: hypothetical protein A2Y77_16910 [Planctomycetes bacterium RBG_13_62_9]|nr:MAG: hypothetical protein A2Y77_16910 [Planctomycetes bacterium RBG_13_62_9]
MLLIVAMLVAACVAPAGAQQTLGDLVADGGYDWVIGKWVTTTEEGQKVEYRLDWALDKHVVFNDIRMGDFTYEGMIMLAPDGMEASDVGADNQGGTWKGTWSEDSLGLAHRVERTGADGEANKLDIIHSRVDADTITIALYGVDSSGSRSSEPMGKLTYKRQTAKAAEKVAAAAETSRSTDYQKLGDLVSEGGYEWLIGKWVATDDSRTYELEHKAILDGHAGLMDMKTGDLTYRGMIMYVPARQEIVHVGLDNMGRVWKGTWEQGDAGLVHKVECTRPDGTSQKVQFVYIKGDNDVLKVREYPVEANGSPASTPRTELTFKRQKPAAKDK